MRKKARVIYNPMSGKQLIKRQLVDILRVFEKAGYETSAYETTPIHNSACDEAIRLSREGIDLIVAAGGDGTINEVVNGMAKYSKKPKLAIIPSGTTNDFARALHIPRNDPISAAKVVLKNRTLNMDIGQAFNDKENKFFINIAGGGYLTELTYEVPSDLKSTFGYLAYLVKGAEMLPKIKPVKMDLKYDDGEYKGEATMFLLALTNSIGGFEQIVPDASLNDGKFTLIILKTGNLVEILHLMAKVLNGGKHVTDPRIIYKKTKNLSVRSLNSKLHINLDGEYGGESPMKFTNLKQSIEIFANIDKMPKDVLKYKSSEIKN